MIIIKHNIRQDDIGVKNMIQMNSCMQYFHEHRSYSCGQVIPNSQLVSFRKRFCLVIIDSLKDDLIGKVLKLKAIAKHK